MTRPRPTPIYHFAPLDNVSGIALYGAIRCDDDAQSAGSVVRDIGEPDLKSKRRSIQVPCHPGGMLSSYVPFYFAPRSPMMSSLAHGNVPGYHGGQDPLVYFVTSVETIESFDLSWVFSDRHVRNRIVNFHNDFDQLDYAVDWEVMKLRFWNETYDVRERRQAEFDVLDEVPLGAIEYCVTRNHHSKAVLARALDDAGWETHIEVHNDDKWYFSDYP